MKFLLIPIATILLSLNSCISKTNRSTVQSILQSKIETIISAKKGTIGVSIIGPKTSDNVSINGEEMFPMLSTFKFPIALMVLHKVEVRELSMQQQVFIKKKNCCKTLGARLEKNILRVTFPFR